MDFVRRDITTPSRTPGIDSNNDNDFILIFIISSYLVAKSCSLLDGNTACIGNVQPRFFIWNKVKCCNLESSATQQHKYATDTANIIPKVPYNCRIWSALYEPWLWHSGTLQQIGEKRYQASFTSGKYCCWFCKVSVLRKFGQSFCQLAGNSPPNDSEFNKKNKNCTFISAVSV